MDIHGVFMSVSATASRIPVYHFALFLMENRRIKCCSEIDGSIWWVEKILSQHMRIVCAQNIS